MWSNFHADSYFRGPSDEVMVWKSIYIEILCFIHFITNSITYHWYLYLLYMCYLLYSLLSVSTADVNTLIACFFLWEYHLKCSWFLCNSFLLDEIPFPLPKSRETKDAVVFNGFHLIGKSLIDPCFMIMNVISILVKVPSDLHQDGLASLLWKHLLENWMCCLALHPARQCRGSHSSPQSSD